MSTFVVISFAIAVLWFLIFTTLLCLALDYANSNRKNRFEICDRSVPFRRFITVLDTFKHHYTGDTMRYIRIETRGAVGAGGSLVVYETVDEERWNQLRKRRVKERNKVD